MSKNFLNMPQSPALALRLSSHQLGRPLGLASLAFGWAYLKLKSSKITGISCLMLKLRSQPWVRFMVFSRTPETFKDVWWRQRGSNPRPHACKARALPTELCPQYLKISIKLSNGGAWPKINLTWTAKWWVWVDSNHRPHAYQACALTGLSYRPYNLGPKPCGHA